MPRHSFVSRVTELSFSVFAASSHKLSNRRTESHSTYKQSPIRTLLLEMKDRFVGLSAFYLLLVPAPASAYCVRMKTLVHVSVSGF